MYVNIDMTNLRFMHKHHDRDTISALAFLETADRSTLVENIDRPEFLNTVAHGDLCHLYQNTTGDDFREGQWGERRDQFRERLREAARNMPMTTALAEEVLAQVTAVEDRLHKGERFKYALGSRVPAQPQELFPLPTVPLAPTQIAAADFRAAEAVRHRAEQAEVARLRAEQGLSTRQALPTAPAAPTAPGTLAPAQTPAPALHGIKQKSAAGAVRAICNAAAEKAWEAAGKPTGEEELKVLARGLVAGIIEKGHNPNTTRIKLSEWAKAKFAQISA
jgi:hypothetical protein